jgi:signal transduction histidine kinase
LSKTKTLIALAVVLVALPVAILAVLQYSFLTHLEAGAKAAIRENLQQTLQAVAAQAQRDMETLGRQALSPLDDAGTALSAPELEKQFAAVLGSHPEVKQLVIYRQSCTHQGDCRTLAYFADSQGVERIDGMQADHGMKANLALSAYHQAVMGYRSLPTAKQEFVFWQHCPACSETNGIESLYIFRPFGRSSAGLSSEDQGNGFAGLVVDPEYLRAKYLGQLAANVLGTANGGRFKPALAVLDQDHRQIFGDSTGKSYEVEAGFSPVFPNWRLAISYRNQTVEGLARETFLRTLVVTIVVLMVLVSGLALALRATAREIKLAEAKSAFVSNVSHELETPLSLIRLLSETLELGRVKDQAKTQEYYRLIHSESCRLSGLINDILDFSQIERGRKEYKFAPENVGEVVENLLDVYRQQIQSQGFELALHVERQLPQAMIDCAAISRAVLNLINNAVKYSPKIKKISVRVQARGEGITIEVADCGIGISRSEQKRIFEKFYRVGSELVHDTKGSGLGLSLVKHIVEAHQGKITVDSAPGKGSVFTILLPTAGMATTASGGYELAQSPDC